VFVIESYVDRMEDENNKISLRVCAALMIHGRNQLHRGSDSSRDRVGGDDVDHDAGAW